MQFRPVVSAFFFIALKNMWLLINICHLAKKNNTAPGEAMLFLPACYIENNHTLPHYDFYTVYEIAIRLDILTLDVKYDFFRRRRQEVSR